jgi:hypothetical protein
MGKWLGIRRLTEDDFLDFFHPRKIKFPISYQFLDAIKTGRRPSAEIEIGHLSTTLIHLGNLAMRVGRSLNFDPRTEQIIGDDDANQLLKRRYRKEGHWAIPKGTQT